MKPIAITEDMLVDLIQPKLITYNPPEGLEELVAPISGAFEMGVPHRRGPDRIYVPLQLEDGELQSLLRGEPIWLTFLSHRMPVFAIGVRPTAHDGMVDFIDGPLDGKVTLLAVIKELAQQADVPLEEAVFDEDGGLYRYASGSLLWSPQ